MTWEYIAGFFDGEGSLAKNGNGFRISIPQTNLEVVETIKRFSGVGTICIPTKRQSHWKDSWIFFIAKQESVHFFLGQIMPFLIVKKALAMKTFPKLERIVKDQHSVKRRREEVFAKVSKLRSGGLSYRRIGKEVGLDHGHVRRLLLRRSKTWCP